MRKRTADVPLHTLHAPEHGALRSYTTRGGAFILSRLSATKHSAAGAWRLTHQPSGAVSLVSSYADGVGLIRRLQTAPAPGDGATQRFVILPRTAPMGGAVLFDRATGKWFPRAPEHPVRQEELEGMVLLQPTSAVVAATEWQMEMELNTVGLSALDAQSCDDEGEDVAEGAVARSKSSNRATTQSPLAR